MPTIKVEETVDVSSGALFAVVTDHEGYGRFRGVQKCELIRTGRVELEALHANRTNVVWTSTFEFPLPIIGRPIGKRVAAQVTRAFRAAIRKAAALALKQAA